MRCLNLIPFFIVFTVVSGCGKNDYPPLEVMQSQFGIVKREENGKLSFSETSVIPLKIGQTYMWRVKFRSNLEEIKYQEVIILPKKTTWVISKDKSKGVLELQEILDGRGMAITRVTPNNGVIFGAWSVAKEDSPGVAQIQLWVNQKKLKEYHFELKDDSDMKKDQSRIHQ